MLTIQNWCLQIIANKTTNTLPKQMRKVCFPFMPPYYSTCKRRENKQQTTIQPSKQERVDTNCPHCYKDLAHLSARVLGWWAYGGRHLVAVQGRRSAGCLRSLEIFSCDLPLTWHTHVHMYNANQWLMNNFLYLDLMFCNMFAKRNNLLQRLWCVILVIKRF